MTTVKSAEIYQPVALQNLPNGEYPGRWSGYEATAIINGTQYRFQTVDGIRAMNAKCTITIGDGSVIVEIKSSIDTVMVSQVYRHKETGKKYVIRNADDIDQIEQEIAVWDKVADTPHGDGDYSYLCGENWCRCSQ